MPQVPTVTEEEKLTIVKTHYAVIKNVLGNSDERACDFMAWAAKFFSENPEVLKTISDPQSRDKIFGMAVGMANNPLLKKMF